MRKLVAFAIVAALAGTGTSDNQAISVQVQNALTTIDQVPTQGQLNTAFQGSNQVTAAGLVLIAQDTTTPGIVGIRLRAIRSLASYCPPPSGQTTGCDDL